jgi:NAD(P)-dependent dehydrogenase (short-subunit alcohol dehydrogenase family)
LITGAASGLGAACAARFHAAGAYIVLADLNEAAGSALAAQLGERVAFVRMDVTSSADVEAALAQAATLGPLRGVIHCAGILGAAKVLGRGGPHDLDLFARIVQVNLIGTFNVVRLAAAVMSRSEPLAPDGERGVIVNTASVAAFDGQIGQAAYAASKGGVASMTLPLARDLGEHGIRVVAIAPGVFDTAMMGAAPEPLRASLAAQIPFPRRLGHADEFAALAQHVVENPMLNGAVLRLDGGLRMAPK